MPQFNLSTYPSQIFWLLFCFLVIYFVVSTIILPRIAKILFERDQIINGSAQKTKELEEKITLINQEISQIKADSSKFYQQQILQSQQQASKLKESLKQELKEKINLQNVLNNQEITNFLNNFSSQKDQIILNCKNAIKNKILH